MTRFDLWHRARFAPDGEGGGGSTTATSTATGGGSTTATTTATTTTATNTATTTTPTGLEWMADLPEDIRADETLKRFTAKDAKEALGKVSASYLSAKRMVSEGALPMPKTDEDRAKIFDALGRPKTEGDYSHKPDAKKLEAAGLKPQEASTKAWNALAHKIGLSDAQHKAIADAYWSDMMGFAEGIQSARATEFAEGEAALKKEWPGDQFDQNSKIAKAAIAKLGGEEFVEFLDQTGLGNHPALMKFAHAAGLRTMTEEELVGATRATGGMTPDQIAARKAEIKADKAWLDGRHPQHKALVAEMQKLNDYLHPQPKQ